VYSLWRFRFTS